MFIIFSSLFLSESSVTGGPTIQTITRTSQGNPATSSSQPKVVTPSAGGIVVTQLPPGLTLRPGGLSVTSQGKVVSGAHAGGQAGLLSQIIMQSSGVLTGTNTSQVQSKDSILQLCIMLLIFLCLVAICWFNTRFLCKSNMH